MLGQNPKNKAEKWSHAETDWQWYWRLPKGRNQQTKRLRWGTSSLIKKEISELKNLIQQIEGKYRDPESKNKLKQLKVDAQKQIERNKIILKDVINRYERYDLVLLLENQEVGPILKAKISKITWREEPSTTIIWAEIGKRAQKGRPW